jgi:ABC-2 type transport system ATP-binding protein
MEHVIKVNNLKKHYKEIKAVDGIDLEIGKGQIIAILGPNGAGKTTTIETLEGLRKPTSGEIYYFGSKVNSVDEKIKERIGVQLQSSTFFPNLKVHEIIQSFGGLYKKRVSTELLIDKFNLKEKEDTYIKNLSGGQKQRVALACAVVNDPDIIFLDEPTTGLDPQARRHLWDSIEELKKDGKTVILTTHYMEEAEYLADKVYIIDHGKIIAKGTVAELISKLEMSSVIFFTIENNINFNYKKIFENKVTLINGKYEYETNFVEKSLIEIFEKTKSNGLTIEDLHVRKPNLENVFLHLTGRSLRE